MWTAGSSWPFMKQGDYPRALKNLSLANEFLSNPGNEKYIDKIPGGKTPESIRFYGLSYVQEAFGGLYAHVGNYDKALLSLKEAINFAGKIKDTLQLADSYSSLSITYFLLNKPDSSLYASQKAVDFYLAGSTRKYLAGVYVNIGKIHKQKGNYHLAKEYFEKAIQAGTLYYNSVLMGEAHLLLASLYQSVGKPDSGLYQSKKAIDILSLSGKEKSIAVAYSILSGCYLSLGNRDSAFFYLQKATFLNDKLDKIEKEKIKEFQIAGFEETLKYQELEKEKIQTQNKIRTFGMLGGLAVLSLIGFILYRSNRQKQKANAVLERTLANLKAAQSQLVQSEKMASLGELTAGIAHEIQNPLNFVNNFSEVNKELLTEMNDEIVNGNFDEVKAIAKDIIDNEEKINLHGKRADAIIKGMLQHSQIGSGEKEPTDINALADEYLRLAYHGLKAKDKSFNASLKTDFDPSIGTINIIPQDIGRVLLNLINNAFYAVNERSKEQVMGYEPAVSVCTKKVNGELEIRVADNGSGIPEKVLDKVFQPFFTTKPTGQGTGLGLSLSYDIIKAHQGKISIKNTPGAGAEFIITLPINA
jgi:signal transduction histidine kinase